MRLVTIWFSFLGIWFDIHSVPDERTTTADTLLFLKLER